ncbi:hypothetical protein TUN199_09961 [Pyrenophora tritici-repentis]|nr:hypothetical protein Alg130_05636 [Pyrenophora tritici-repentis]KAI0610235.1 hypothetical protein TUN205_05527 [Pyrenophora tritici-repentis]KAI0618052.1 hypothetical protein TUN199_09961 [Pyrenophora tritici-repentis]
MAGLPRGQMEGTSEPSNLPKLSPTVAPQASNPPTLPNTPLPLAPGIPIPPSVSMTAGANPTTSPHHATTSEADKEIPRPLETPQIPHTLEAKDSSAIGSNQTPITPVASAVPSTHLMDAPAINFNEITKCKLAPARSTYSEGRRVFVDPELPNRLTNLKDTLRYPMRTKLRTGPGKGQVLANYFELLIDPKAILIEYQIHGIPDSEPSMGKSRYMNTAIQPYATGVRVHVGNPITSIRRRWRLIDITDRGTTANLCLDHADPTTYDPTLAENVLNTIITKCIRQSNMLHLNNHKFYVRDSFQDLRTREQHAIAPLRSMRGYSYRIHPTIGKVLLNISPANSAFWRPFLVHEVLRNGNGSFGGLIEGGQRALKNIRVYITYDRDNKDGRCKNPKFKDAVCGTGTSKSKMSKRSLDVQHARVKKIRGFGKECKFQDFLWEHRDASGNVITGDTVTVTVKQYQRLQYGRTLRHGELSAVNVGTALAPS